jgi:hypothetical protein
MKNPTLLPEEPLLPLRVGVLQERSTHGVATRPETLCILTTAT